MTENPQELEWQERKAAADKVGKCVHSGLLIAACKAWLCDCYDYPEDQS